MSPLPECWLSQDVQESWYQPHWYAVYICARHEKKAADLLTQRSVETYIPLYESVHRWKDRKVRVQLPLFPGYLFVRIALQEKLRVVTVPGVVHLVGTAGQPTSLPDAEIEGIRQYLASAPTAQPCSYLTTGRPVRVKAGALQGCKGIVVRRKKGLRVVIKVEAIMRAFAIEVDAADLEPADCAPVSLGLGNGRQCCPAVASALSVSNQDSAA